MLGRYRLGRKRRYYSKRVTFHLTSPRRRFSIIKKIFNLLGIFKRKE